jgi:hypothetical protein
LGNFTWIKIWKEKRKKRKTFIKTIIMAFGLGESYNINFATIVWCKQNCYPCQCLLCKTHACLQEWRLGLKCVHFHKINNVIIKFKVHACWSSLWCNYNTSNYKQGFHKTLSVLTYTYFRHFERRREDFVL